MCVLFADEDFQPLDVFIGSLRFELVEELAS